MKPRDYLGLVAQLPCVLCIRLGFLQETRTECHHVREGQGGAQRSSDFTTAALCTDCHRGRSGLHGDRRRLLQANCDEMDLLADTIEAVHRLRDKGD
jgi:hypothetical protein